MDFGFRENDIYSFAGLIKSITEIACRKHSMQVTLARIPASDWVGDRPNIVRDQTGQTIFTVLSCGCINSLPCSNKEMLLNEK